MGGVKGKVMGPFKSNATKPTCITNVNRCRMEARNLKAQIEDIITKDVRNLFELEQGNEGNNDRIIRDIKKFFELEGYYYEPVNAGNFNSNNYIKYESNDYRYKSKYVKEYLEEIKRYLRDIIVSKNLTHGNSISICN